MAIRYFITHITPKRKTPIRNQLRNRGLTNQKLNYEIFAKIVII